MGPGLFIVVLFVTHLTSIYDDALSNRWLHDAEHAAYMVSACAMWTAVMAVGTGRAVARLGSVFGVIASGAFLAVVLMSASEPLMPTYEARLGSADALDDQRSAAAIMWTAGMLTTLPLLIAAVWRWAATEQRVAVRAEALADDAASRRATPWRRSIESQPEPCERLGEPCAAFREPQRGWQPRPPFGAPTAGVISQTASPLLAREDALDVGRT